MHEHLTRTTIDALNESGQDLSMNDENVLIGKDRMVEHFGGLYATQPQNFRFSIGERILIRELVSHVKNVVDNQGKKGLKMYKAQKLTGGKKKSCKSSISEPEHDNLKSQLLKRLIACMHSHEAEQFFNANLESIVDENAVDVRIKKGVGVFGSVRCLICDTEGKSNNKPKRVHYNSNSNWPCWVLENFKKHLRNVHKLQCNKNRKLNAEQLFVDEHQVKQEPNTIEEYEVIEEYHVKEEYQVKEEHPCKEETIDNVTGINSSVRSQDDSLAIIYEEKAEPGDDLTLDSSTENTERTIYSQFTTQINFVFAATLQNSEEQERVTFVIDDMNYDFQVAIINSDGNCLFSSLAHQLYGLKIGSRPHTRKTNELRKRVVEHILDPKNFPNYAYQLQECVYRSMKKEEVTDMTTECKLYVKLVLAKKGSWGGAESIKAISKMEEVNIIIFNENGPCYMLSNVNKTFQRSVGIAYRFAQKGDEWRTHYDSVCDVDANLFNLIAREISKQK